MPAAAASPYQEIEPFSLDVPEPMLRRLGQRLGRDRADGQVWDMSTLHGVQPDLLGQLVDFWCDDFDFRREEARCNELPLFTAHGLPFAHARSAEIGALPLLLLHGSFGSIAEFRSLLPRLTAPVGKRAEAFDVIVPWLPSFGLDTASACAELMASLGYQRYVTHGSEQGSELALELARLDAAHLAGIHVTRCLTLPGGDPFELAQLTAREKSQLALLTWSRNEPAPASPIEQLALALQQLADSAAPQLHALRDSLLASLTLQWLSDARARPERSYALAGDSPIPIGICSFPLEAPTLRRCAEQRHRVVDFREHERGGSMPALEQPELFERSLLDFFAHFR